MNPAYFQTRFRSSSGIEHWPELFAIITAYATTGESWTPEQNEAADRELEEYLKAADHVPFRVTGYSPETGHAEPGWAVETTWQDACDIGLRFRQDAIYCVRGNDLFVTLCDDRRKLVEVGAFHPRMTVDG